MIKKIKQKKLLEILEGNIEDYKYYIENNNRILNINSRSKTYKT